MMMDHAVEKRQHIRIPLTFVSVDVISKIQVIESSETCSIIDISESGMKFVSTRHYDIGSPMQLTFVLPASTIPIQAKALVVYQQLHNLLFSTGAKFTILELVEFTLLKTYIEALVKKN
ncbi:MAG: PilZ domain-containing protein [Chitinivibrionales bacterium]|nr:PilZ domain-containing protein [Chitinivibrionales bacterium]